MNFFENFKVLKTIFSLFKFEKSVCLLCLLLYTQKKKLFGVHLQPRVRRGDIGSAVATVPRWFKFQSKLQGVMGPPLCTMVSPLCSEGSAIRRALVKT